MNTGTSGSVSSITPAESGSIDGDEDEHRDRDGDGQDDLRQIAGERRLERVDTRDRGRRHLGALGAVERGGTIAQPSLDELEPQRREHVGRRPPADDLEARGGRRPADRRGDEQREQPGQLVERRPVERARRDGRDQDGLGEDEQRRDDAERDVEREQRPHGARAADEARVERPHRAPRRRSRAGRDPTAAAPPRRRSAAPGRRGTSTPGRAG